MTRTTKTFLKAAFVFALIGSAFCIAGFCMGFTVKGFRGAVNSGTFELVSSSGTGDWITDMAGGKADFRRTFSDVKSLDLELGAAECTIFEGEGENWEIAGYNFPSSFTCEMDGKTLEISGMNKSWLSIGAGNHAQLEIYMPSGQKLDKVEIDAGVGSIVSETMFSCKELEVSCGVGSCDLWADVSKKVEIEGGVGEINLLLAGRAKDFNYDLECGIGDVTVGDMSFGGIASDHKMNNNAQKSIKAECGVGSVSVLFEEE